jgi:hypothetical protein
VTGVLPRANVLPEGLETFTAVTPQLSVADAFAKLTIVVQRPGDVEALTFAGQEILGSSESCTVILNEQLFVFPMRSVLA